ncbi:MAG: hypothetical protein RIE08_08095 [Acidimicrobiales bacterium]
MENEDFEAHRESRRDLLKKAGVGAAIVWAAPVVSSVVTPAAAQTGGGGEPQCDTYYRVKIDRGDSPPCDDADNHPCAPSSPPNAQSSWADGCPHVTVGTLTSTSHTITLPSTASNIIAYNKSGTPGGGGPQCSTTHRNASTTVSTSGDKVVTLTADDISHIVVTFCLPDDD